MIRPLAVLLALAVIAVGGSGALPAEGGSEVALRTVSVGPPTTYPTAPRPRLQPDADRRSGAGVSRSVVRASASTDEDFAVTLDSLSPAVIPRRGPLRLGGTVTNTTNETWTDLNIHPFTSYSPMTTVREVEVAAESDPQMYVGERIVAPGAFDDSIRVIAPGDTLRWSVRIPRDVLVVSGEPGVYWIGVHVLGATEAGRDGLAHGRVRSFIVLPDRRMDRVPTSLVVPVRQAVVRDDAGRVTRLGSWTRQLRSGGRLDDLLSFARRSPESPVTWLVDPAVLDALRQLAVGNPPRSLRPPEGEASGEEDPGPADGDGDDGTDAGSDRGSDHETGQPAGVPPAEDEQPDPDAAAVAPLAEAWLESMLPLLAEDRVLGLPYGDIDVSAVAEHAAGLYTRARSLAERSFEAHGLTAVPAVVPPSGVLSAGGIRLAADDSQIFLTTDALPAALADDDVRPGTITTGTARIAILDDAVAAGGPGPDDPLAPLAMRQRVLAAAAVRGLAQEPASLQVLLPPGFSGDVAGRFLGELDQDFVGLAPAGVDSGGPAPEVAQTRYPDEAATAELGAVLVTGVQDLVGVGHRLDSILPGTDEVAHQVTAQALCSASYHARRRPLRARAAVTAAADRLRGRLEEISIDAPSFVILSSESGPFAVTMSNGLEEPVVVRVAAHAAEDLVINAPEDVEVAPESQRTVQLTARADSIGVHSLELVVTDLDGNPIGASDSLSVRTNSVGQVIWVVLGAGVGILFLAILVRLVRRWRGRRTA